MMKLAVCVSNDLTSDQRMHRVSSALQNHGKYNVQLIGRVKKSSQALDLFAFKAKRLFCFFEKGFLFYLEYNVRLLIHLIINRPDIVYACDPDTLLGAKIYILLFNKKSIYDSHEYFIETPELKNKKFKKLIWNKIERYCSSGFDLYFTVNDQLANILTVRLGSPFHTIRNLPLLYTNKPSNTIKDNIILYQGVLNEGRGLEQAIQAMDQLPNYKLVLAGDGDLSFKLKNMAQSKSNVHLTGLLKPEELSFWTAQAKYGLNLLDSSSLNYYYSLANKFFDYMKFGVPSINMAFPVYNSYLSKYNCGVSIANLSPNSIVACINLLDKDNEQYHKLSNNALLAHQELNWENESYKLLKLVDTLQTK